MRHVESTWCIIWDALDKCTYYIPVHISLHSIALYKASSFRPAISDLAARTNLHLHVRPCQLCAALVNMPLSKLLFHLVAMASSSTAVINVRFFPPF